MDSVNMKLDNIQIVRYIQMFIENWFRQSQQLYVCEYVCRADGSRKRLFLCYQKLRHVDSV